MTVCSKRKTRRSLLRDSTPPSCSHTQKVSCCSSFPWEVSFPWTQEEKQGEEEEQGEEIECSCVLMAAAD